VSFVSSTSASGNSYESDDTSEVERMKFPVMTQSVDRAKKCTVLR